MAGGKPFEAKRDTFDAAMDMIHAAAFAFGDDMSLIKSQLANLVVKDGLKLSVDSNGSILFPRPPVVPEIAALQAVVNYLGDQVKAPIPKLSYWYRYLTDSSYRSNIAIKDQVIKAQINKSLQRHNSGDNTQESATDYLIQRENSVAKKEGRDPDFFSRRTIDEVGIPICPIFYLI
jgi:hypothetical protein